MTSKEPKGKTEIQADVRTITRAVRAADEAFETVGGSSRHWVRECLLPALEDEGLEVVVASDRAAVRADERAKVVEEIVEYVDGTGDASRPVTPANLQVYLRWLADEIRDSFGGKTK
jgi:hypothetical protein